MKRFIAFLLAGIALCFGTSALAQCSISVEAKPVKGEVPLTVKFVAQATAEANIVKYEWGFKRMASLDMAVDVQRGRKKIKAESEYTYGASGVYWVTFKATDATGATYYAIKKIRVLPKSRKNTWEIYQ